MKRDHNLLLIQNYIIGLEAKYLILKMKKIVKFLIKDIIYG